jgi:cyclopropane-fatty-acyl-phospholipid synthase
MSSADSFRRQLESLAASADVKINGDRPWDIQVHNPDFYRRVLAEGSMGAGESYMEGWWDSPALDEMLTRIMRAGIEDKIKNWRYLSGFVKAKLINLQNPSRAFTIGQHHYDMGNDLYKHMLGKRLMYSCGYWKEADNLDDAQEAKLDLICRKLGLEPGMRVLDIGCGWGEMPRFAAERYQVEVVGVTVSEQQASYAREICAGLPVEIRLQDYREVNEPFDRILSIGMIEHVGYKNYRTYMNVVRRCLADDGLFLLHCIGSNTSVANTDPWIAKYIFPNSMLPSAKQICAAIEGKFVFEDWQNFGPYYDKTLLAWRDNFEAHWNEIKAGRDEHFYRMWRFYLLTSAATFRARKSQLWQVVLSPRGLPQTYQSPR